MKKGEQDKMRVFFVHTIKIPCHIVYVRNYFFAKSLLNQLQLEKLNIKILQFCPKALLKKFKSSQH